MRLALWDLPLSSLIKSGFDTEARGGAWEIVQVAGKDAAGLLQTGHVDVALLPTLTVLLHPDLFDVVPAVALSGWDYPFARLFLRRGFEDPVLRLDYDPSALQEALLARIILREHYDSMPELVPLEGLSEERLAQHDADAVLFVGAGVPLLAPPMLSLDLGQEWYELTNYPMVWGLYATRKGEAPEGLVEEMRIAASRSEEARSIWMQNQPPALHDFFENHLRLRLDDLAVAGLTAFREQLFYMEITPDVVEIPYLAVPDEEEGGDLPL